MTTALRTRDVEPGSSTTALPELPALERRLLRLWASLALRSAEAAAHLHPAAGQLLNRQIEVENLILDRRPDLQPTLDEYIVWESTLIHSGSGELPGSCLACRRAPTTMPAELRRSTGRSTR
jgi:hypothetical protein